MKNNTILIIILISIFISYFNPILAQQDDIAKKVDEYLNAYIQMDQFSGSVLIVKDGQVVTMKGYGKACYEYDIKNDPQTKFRIASLTKSFTAVAILQLEEQNLLSVDDKLDKYITDYPRGDEITINNLLTHTSGITNHSELEDFYKERRVYSFDISKTIEAFKNKPLEFTPNEKFSYSNSNYILLGYIIETVSKMTYEEYIEQNIFKPLKMNNSGFEHPEKIIVNFAQGYSLKKNEIVKADFRNMSNTHASGAIYSTIEDLYLWDRALYSEKLISKESKEKMFTVFKDSYGYGWGILEMFNHKMIGHNGDIEGFTSNISRFVNDDACIIILSNFGHTQVGRISYDLAAILFNEDYSVPEILKTIELNEDILIEYVGKYELNPDFNFNITIENGVLYCQATGQGKLELSPISKTEFILKEVDAKISFWKNENGGIEKLILHQGGKEFSSKRMN